MGRSDGWRTHRTIKRREKERACLYSTNMLSQISRVMLKTGGKEICNYRTVVKRKEGRGKSFLKGFPQQRDRERESESERDREIDN